MVLATIVALASVFGLGICLALLGSVKIRLTERLGIDDAQMGKLFSVFNFSNLVFVLVAGVLCDRLGFPVLSGVGFILAGLAIFLFGRATTYGAAVLGCLLLGIGGMFINTVGNALFVNPQILFEDAGRSSNLGNVFFGIGAFVTPLLTAWLFKKTSYQNALAVLAVILFIPIIFVIFGTFPPAMPGFSFADATALVGQIQIILGALGLMCYIALEVSMGGWITTYVTSLGAEETRASRILSGYWIALMAGRLITALFIADRLITLDVNGPWFVLALAVVASIVIYYMSTVGSLGAGATLSVVTGLVFAPIFPTIVGVTLSRTTEALRGSGFGVIFAVGLIGAIFLPAWMGAISKGKDIKSSMKVASATAAVLVVLALIMGLALGPPIPVAVPGPEATG